MRAMLAALLLMSAPALAEAPDVAAIVDQHVLPGYETLASQSAALAEVAATQCTPSAPALETAYHAAFDAWVRVSHLRFGPSEQNERAFSLAFWPDPRSSTPKALRKLLAEADATLLDPDAFATVSIAARGFYALEYLLFDPSFGPEHGAAYHCALVQAVTRDISKNADGILEAWTGGYAVLMRTPGNETYRSTEEAAKQLFTALSTGLEFTAATRLGRPMGTFDKPRPKRAEARRSGRTLRHVILSLEATRDLAVRLAGQDAGVVHGFKIALERAEQIDDPVLALVATPQGRLRVEVLQQKIDIIRQHLAEEVGPSLGIAAGFNSLDGD